MCLMSEHLLVAGAIIDGTQPVPTMERGDKRVLTSNLLNNQSELLEAIKSLWMSYCFVIL